MRLFIAEKPSLARAIADVLPPPHVKRGSYIECGADNVVAWCAGHILELADPDQYAPEYKTWSLQHLPIVPARWKLSPTSPDLLKTIASLLPKAERVVHAGDPDREGQLLVDEVLEFLGYRGQVDRLLISDLNPQAVRKALADLKPNATFRPLYQAALARQRADWLYGLNLTRLYTLLGRAGGYEGVLSVGRVQTPLLGLIVRRDLEIAAFQPKPYFVLVADVDTGDGRFAATWQPGPTVEDALDADHRLTNPAIAGSIQRKASGNPGQITKRSHERKSVPPPLPYSLPELQVDAAKQLNLSPKQILDVCQSLYETHRLTTYPRSDCSYLPEAHHSQASQIVAAISRNAAQVQRFAGGAQLPMRSRAWNDSKITAHHAIIPTPHVVPEGSLSSNERDVYGLIARRYMAQFYSPYEYNQTDIEILVAGERFTASGRQPLVQGWHAVLSPDADEHPDEGPESDVVAQVLPVVVEGQAVTAAKVSIVDRKTKPPKSFTNATLIQAMTGIAKFVSDPRIKKLLREADGLGTPATQASIIQTLFDRHYIVEEGRKIVSTPTARALVTVLPGATTQPDMTALWEAATRQIQEGSMPLDTFLAGVLKQLGELVAHGKSLGALHLPGVAPPKPCTHGCGGFLRQRRGKNGAFLGCSRYPDCTATVQDGAEAHRGQRTSRGSKRRSRTTVAGPRAK